MKIILPSILLNNGFSNWESCGDGDKSTDNSLKKGGTRENLHTIRFGAMETSFPETILDWY